MATGSIEQRRTPIEQPNRKDTRKSQKGYIQPEEYSADALNRELDRLHERINQIVVETIALTDLDTATATTAQIATQVNLISELLRQAGLPLRE